MANTKISDLPAVTDVLSTDEYVLARSGVSKKIDASDLGAGLAVSSELDYVQITSGVNILSTTEATPTTIITGTDLTVDGSTVVMVEFFSRSVLAPLVAGGFVIVNLHGSTNSGSSYSDLGRIAALQVPSATAAGASALGGQVRQTPAAGTVKYRIVAWASSTTGTPSVAAGAGGAGTGVPAFLRVTAV
jgi:hypothetical protein